MYEQSQGPITSAAQLQSFEPKKAYQYDKRDRYQGTLLAER